MTSLETTAHPDEAPAAAPDSWRAGDAVADWWRVSGRAPNAMFMGDIDAKGFFALLTERLARL